MALSPQQCEAWIEGAAALIQWYRTKSNKNPNIEKFYSIFFKKSRSPEAGPLVAPRKARNTRPAHGAKFPLAAAGEIPAPRTGRNSRWPQPAKHPPAAAGEIPAPRTGRNSRWPQPAKHPRRARRETPLTHPHPSTTLTRAQRTTPRVVGARAASKAHFQLPDSLRMVSRVVEQGQ